MTKRYRDWQTRFAACLAERWARPFAWGSQDCGLFAADGVLAITGRDPAADLRGRYKTEQGAARVIKRLGGLGSIAAARFGAEVWPALAQPGDVGLLVLADRELLAICNGTNWLAPGEHGVVQMSSSSAVRAWRCVRTDA
jgi:hypothetical protein